MDWVYRLIYANRSSDTPIVPEPKIPSWDERNADDLLRAIVARESESRGVSSLETGVIGVPVATAGAAVYSRFQGPYSR